MIVRFNIQLKVSNTLTRLFVNHYFVKMSQYYSSLSTNISIYIPHVFPNIDEKRICDIFQKLNLGKVSKVDFVGNCDRHGKAYNSVYVSFTHWYNNEAAINLQNRILDPEQEARIVYDDPWYWVILENTGKKQVVNGRKVRINLDTLFEKAQPIRLQEENVMNLDQDSPTQNYLNSIQKYNEAYKHYENAYAESLTAWNNYYYSSLMENYYRTGSGDHLLTPTQAIARINEIREYLSHDYDKKNIQCEWLSNLGKELTDLEDILMEYEKEQQYIDTYLVAFKEFEDQANNVQNWNMEQYEDIDEELLEEMEEAEKEWQKTTFGSYTQVF